MIVDKSTFLWTKLNLLANIKLNILVENLCIIT